MLLLQAGWAFRVSGIPFLEVLRGSILAPGVFVSVPEVAEAALVIDADVIFHGFP